MNIVTCNKEFSRTTVVRSIRFWICFFVGFALTISTIYTLRYQLFTRSCQSGTITTIMLVLRTCAVTFLALYNFWKICIRYTEIAFLDSKLHLICKSFLHCCILFTIGWFSCCLFLEAMLWLDQWCGSVDNGYIPIALLLVIIWFFGVTYFALIGVYLESISVMMQMLSWLLFWIKLYAAVSVVVSCVLGFAFNLIVSEENEVEDDLVIEYYIIWFLISICALAIWWKVRSIERQMSRSNIEYPQRLQLDQCGVIPQEDEHPSEEPQRHICIKMYHSAKTLWKRNKFWAQNFIVIMNCVVTFVGVLIPYINDLRNGYDRQWNDSYDYWDDHEEGTWICDDDNVRDKPKYCQYDDHESRMFEIGIFCGFIMLTSIWSMLNRKFNCRCISACIPSYVLDSPSKPVLSHLACTHSFALQR